MPAVGFAVQNGHFNTPQSDFIHDSILVFSMIASLSRKLIQHEQTFYKLQNFTIHTIPELF